MKNVYASIILILLIILMYYLLYNQTSEMFGPGGTGNQPRH